VLAATDDACKPQDQLVSLGRGLINAQMPAL
jgi:hypothetical protein